jgi:polyphosphate kinase
MTRNMSKRIELAVRLTDPDLIKDIINQLDIILRDTSNARTMDSNMRYSSKEGHLLNSHIELIELYQSIEVSSSKNPKKRHISDWLSLFIRR